MPLRSAKQRGNNGTVPKSQKSGQRDGQLFKDENDAEKEKLKKSMEMYKQENMMLRKNLNMPDIIEELQKSVAENNMEQMFFESLHELQFRLQQYESDSGASESLKVKDLQKELERQKALTDSIRKEVHIKNSRIDELENSLEECNSSIETLSNKVDFISQTNKKLQREKTDLESEQKQLTEEITILKAANTALRAQVSAMEKESQDANKRKLMSLTEEMSEIEKLRQELRDRDQTIDTQKEQIHQLETNIVSTKRLFQESEASMKVLEKTTDRQNDRLGELNKDKEQLHIENEILITDLNSLRSKYEKQTKQVDELKEELEKINELNHTFINELSALRETNVINERIIQELQEKCSKISEISNSGDGPLKEELAKIKSENQTLKSKKEELEITCHDAFEKITKNDKKLKQQEEDYKKLIARKEDTIQKLRQEKTVVDPTRSNATVAEVNALKDKLEKLSKELMETNAEIAMLRKV